jgi:hypothetical protein
MSDKHITVSESDLPDHIWAALDDCISAVTGGDDWYEGAEYIPFNTKQASRGLSFEEAAAYSTFTGYLFDRYGRLPEIVYITGR